MIDLSEEFMDSCTADDLARFVAEGLKPSCLTFAAEILGRKDTAGTHTELLISLLSHPVAVVREGAILGLSDHPTAEVVAAITALRAVELDPGVRSAIADMVDNWASTQLLFTAPAPGGEL